MDHHSKKCILLTGGCGYIGTHILVLLLENPNYDVVVVDNHKNSSPNSLVNVKKIVDRPFYSYNVDLLDEKEMENIFIQHRIDFVIHLAGYKSVNESIEQPLLYYNNNINGLLVLLKFMDKYNVQKLIYSSSATVYGNPHYLPVDEQHPVGKCTNPYGKSKYFCEEILKDLNRQPNNSLQIIILRYFNPVGAHPSGEIGEYTKGTPNNFMPIITNVAAGIYPKFSIFGTDYDTFDGTCIRDYIHVMDLSESHISALNYLSNVPKGEPVLQIVNIGTGCGYSVMQLIKAYEKASNRAIHYVASNRRPGDVDSIYTDTKLAEKVLGWKAKYGIDDMCKHAWNWITKYPKGYSD